MVYPYRCDDCGRQDEIWKPAAECGTIQICPDCNSVMERVFTAPAVHIPSGSFNPGLGNNSIGDLRSRGLDPVCVGDDRVDVKPHEKSYDLSRSDIGAINSMIGDA
jgi:putative FmdB family regulatory protein